eukprot:TRINITY_DN990_c5_g1_i1.p1 TRINITY_DN990_c5_g1~~TRINITY_DN990_c5_g1_i1.p1  ORF type:complete len:535 (+),score=133.17 TRINITY_DN990_c5_g1_i1:150-1754(+)
MASVEHTCWHCSGLREAQGRTGSFAVERTDPCRNLSTSVLLRADESRDSTFSLLVANWCRAKSKLSVEVVTSTSKEDQPEQGLPGLVLEWPEGHRISGPSTICKALLAAAEAATWATPADSWSGSLAGDTPEAAAEVDQWLSWRNTVASSVHGELPAKQLADLNEYLAGRAVLVGAETRVTLADVAVFSAVHPTLIAFKPSELAALPHLARWLVYVQGKVDVEGVTKPVEISRPKFSFPMAQPRPTPAAASISSAPSAPAAAAPSGLAGPPPAPPSRTTKGTAAPSAEASSATSSDGKAAVPVAAAAAADGSVPGEALPLPQQPAATDSPAANGSVEGAKDEGKGKGEKKEKDKKEKKEKPPAEKKEVDSSIGVLDIRVAEIKKVWKHPSADTLYVEEIDVGEANTRQVVSGLAKFLTEEEMTGRRVLLLANVKPGKVRDVMSSGLVLCASNADHSKCIPVAPPAEAPIGERVSFAGHQESQRSEEVLNPKKKQLEKILPDLRTNPSGVACYRDVPFKTTAGECTAAIPDAIIK